MLNGPAPVAAPETEPPLRKKESMRSPREDLSITDRLFLAIENPVLRRELLTALRSRKSFVLQFIYLAILGMIVYLAWPVGMIATKSELAQTLFRIFGQSQLVLLSMMSPAFSASAMTIEKERRCMDLLLTSPIRPGTILMGKYMSSVAYLFLLIISTVPIIEVVLWLGGIDPRQIAGLYMILVSVAAAFGMIGLTCSVFFHRSQTSLAITYMIVLPLALMLFVCSQWEGFFLLEWAVWPSALLLVMTFVMYQACLSRLRQPFDPVFKAAEEEDIAAQTGLVLVRDRFPDSLLAPANANELLPDHVNPMYQKEIRSEIFGRGTLFLRLIIQISMFLSVVFLTFLFLGKEYIFVDFLVIFSMLVAPAFACNTFTQERERGTLDLLLTTLIRPSQIVIGKFLACLRLSLFLTGLVGVTLFFYLFISTVGNDSFALRAYYLAIYFSILLMTIVLETSLAMFFSLILQSTVRSMITTYAVVLVLFAVPVAARQLLFAFSSMRQSEFFFALATSPFQAIHSVVPKEMNFADNALIWPYYLGFCTVISAISMGYVFSAFERRIQNNAESGNLIQAVLRMFAGHPK